MSSAPGTSRRQGKMEGFSIRSGLIFMVILLTLSLLLRRSSAVDFEKCMKLFLNDTEDLDQERFKGYWHVVYSFTPYRPWVSARNTQFFYVYEKNDTFGVWYIAEGLNIVEGLCYRRVMEIPETTAGSRLFKEFTFFHNVIDTDYENYAVVLVCSGIRFPGVCEYHNIKTLVLSRTADIGDLQKDPIWSKVNTSVSDCADPSRLVELRHNVCVCADLEKFTSGLGKECED